MPIAIPPALQSPLPHDAIDEAVPANRAAIIEAGLAVNAHETRLTAHEGRLAALEAAGPAVPTPVAIVPISEDQEGQLSQVGLRGAAILRGPTMDFMMVRQ